MAYTPVYASEDLGAVVVDILVSLGVFFVGFATIFGIVILWRWLKGKKMF